MPGPNWPSSHGSCCPRRNGHSTRPEGGGGDGAPHRVVGALVAVGALASFTMGSSDVANATGSLVGTHPFSPLVAGVVGGAGLVCLLRPNRG